MEHMRLIGDFVQECRTKHAYEVCGPLVPHVAQFTASRDGQIRRQAYRLLIMLTAAAPPQGALMAVNSLQKDLHRDELRVWATATLIQVLARNGESVSQLLQDTLTRLGGGMQALVLDALLSLDLHDDFVLMLSGLLTRQLQFGELATLVKCLNKYDTTISAAWLHKTVIQQVQAAKADDDADVLMSVMTDLSLVRFDGELTRDMIVEMLNVLDKFL